MNGDDVCRRASVGPGIGEGRPPAGVRTSSVRYGGSATTLRRAAAADPGGEQLRALTTRELPDVSACALICPGPRPRWGSSASAVSG